MAGGGQHDDESHSCHGDRAEYCVWICWRRQREAPFYNFGKGSQALYRQPQGQKQMAVSVRCVRE